jgi:hypothetical protein
MTNSKIKLNLDSLKSRKEWKRHKVKDGHNVFRILPPFGENSNGYPYRKWQIIWGLTDPESGRARPFASSMTSEKRCPIVEYVNQLKARAETLTSQLKAAGTSDDEIKERTKGLQDLIGNLIPKTVYVYNAADKAGEVGLLELKSTAHKEMKSRMNEYIQDYNQDPTSLNSADDDSGVWFDVTRTNETGKFRDTKYDVKKVQTKVKDASGKMSFVDDRSPLADSIVENYENLAYDLSAIYQTKSYDDLQQVLDANMSNLIEICPDADLSVEPSLLPLTQALEKAAAPRAATNAARGTAKVALKLQDDDDAEDNTINTSARSGQRQATGSSVQSTKPAAKASAPAADVDDFMAEADAILNS